MRFAPEIGEIPRSYKDLRVHSIKGPGRFVTICDIAPARMRAINRRRRES